MPTVLHIDEKGRRAGLGGMDPERYTEAERELTTADFGEPFIKADLSQWAPQGVVDHGDCRVYWGSHGCNLKRGHDGPHRCDCADEGGFDPETREYYDELGVFNVGAPPYYGPETHFYGEDTTAPERGES